MQENTNRAIVINSIVLYSKMAITTICSLLITRFALKALGSNDFGLYSVLGGIISLIAIFNAIMLSTSNRFIAVAIGKNNVEEANIQFNVCLTVHILIALFTMSIAIPIGNWYVNSFINYDGDINNALMVFNISIISSIISFVGVPYNGLLMAKERFHVFSFIDIIAHVLKLIIAYLLIDHFDQKLLIYTISLAVLTVLPVLCYWLYCKSNFGDIVRFRLCKEKQRYKEIFNFSAWVSVGAITTVGKSQGAALLVNAFFNTMMNTALGIANSINTYIQMFAQNVTQPMAPQITKSYVSGQQERTNDLLVMSTKFSFMMMFIVSVPFLLVPEWIVQLWLGEVPPYVVIFTVLLIVDNLVQSLNSGILNIIFASGKIAAYQVSVSILNVLSIVLAFIFLKIGFPASSMVGAYILVSVVKFFVLQIVLNKTVNVNNSVLFMHSYLPSFIVVILFLPLLFLRNIFNPLWLLLFSMLYCSACVFFVGLNNRERDYIKKLINKILKIK